jgi:hypothetical protein
MMRFPMMLMLALLLLGTAPMAESPAQLGRFGDFTYDASTYAVEGGEGGEVYVVRSRRDREGDQSMMASIHDAPASDCSVAKLMAEAQKRRGDHSDQRGRTLSRDGFEIHIVSWYWGCRNARPPSVMACTALRGRVYRFHAPSIGCNGGPGFSARPEGFLGSLAIAP